MRPTKTLTRSLTRTLIPALALTLLAGCPSEDPDPVPANDPLVGTWDVRLIAIDGGNTLPCNVTVEATGAFTIECVNDRTPEAEFCDVEESVSRVIGQISGGQLTLEVKEDDRWVGATCEAEQIEVGRTYTSTEVAIEASRTGGGSGLLGGQWDASLFDYDCDDEDLIAPCDDVAGRSRDGEAPATCRFGFTDGVVTLVCRGPGDDADQAICIRGTLGDGAVALEVEELADGVFECGGAVRDREIRIEGAKR